MEKIIAPDVVTYNCLNQGLCNLGRWREAKVSLTRMKDFHIHLDVITYSIIIDALCKEGEVEAAEDISNHD